MTARAHEIGAVDTNFVTTNGLYHPQHYSTAYDLALQQSGPTPALLAGRGRVAARLGDRAAACDAYGLLLRSWTGGPEPPAIAGAREYVAREGC